MKKSGEPDQNILQLNNKIGMYSKLGEHATNVISTNLLFFLKMQQRRIPTYLHILTNNKNMPWYNK